MFKHSQYVYYPNSYFLLNPEYTCPRLLKGTTLPISHKKILIKNFYKLTATKVLNFTIPTCFKKTVLKRVLRFLKKNYPKKPLKIVRHRMSLAIQKSVLVIKTSQALAQSIPSINDSKITCVLATKQRCFYKVRNLPLFNKDMVMQNRHIPNSENFTLYISNSFFTQQYYSTYFCNYSNYITVLVYLVRNGQQYLPRTNPYFKILWINALLQLVVYNKPSLLYKFLEQFLFSQPKNYHRKIILLLTDFTSQRYSSFFKLTNTRGLLIKLSGKLLGFGGSKKRHFIFKFGIYRHTSTHTKTRIYNKLVWTVVGAIGCKIYIN